jgi:hypothetical protein
VIESDDQESAASRLPSEQRLCTTSKSFLRWKPIKVSSSILAPALLSHASYNVQQSTAFHHHLKVDPSQISFHVGPSSPTPTPCGSYIYCSSRTTQQESRSHSTWLARRWTVMEHCELQELPFYRGKIWLGFRSNCCSRDAASLCGPSWQLLNDIRRTSIPNSILTSLRLLASRA